MMSKISSYIQQLVWDNGYAIIPGVGGFVASQVPPSIDRRSGCISRPSMAVTFDSRMRLNDGLLAQKLMSCDEMSYPAAKRMVDAASKQILERLNEGDKVPVDGLGTLTMDISGGIRFVPSGQKPDMSAWGLGTLDMPLLADLEAAAARHDDSGRSQASHQLTVWRYVQYAAACVIALIIYLSFSEPIDNYGIRRYDNYASIVPAASILDMSANPEPVKVISEPGECNTYGAAPQAKPAPPAVAAKAEAGVPAAKGRYCIIVASLAGGIDPQTTIDSFVSKGFEGAFAIRGGGRTRICVAAYGTMGEAVDALRHVTENPACADAWILTRQTE